MTGAACSSTTCWWITCAARSAVSCGRVRTWRMLFTRRRRNWPVSRWPIRPPWSFAARWRWRGSDRRRPQAPGSPASFRLEPIQIEGDGVLHVVRRLHEFDPALIRDHFRVDIADVGMNHPPFDDNGEVPEGQAQLV